MRTVVNIVPPTEDKQIVKTLAFPYQKGPTGFPALAKPTDYTFTNIVALMMTGTGERVMSPDLGVDTYQYVFENMTPIQKVRLASTVANAIETFVPGTVVNSVTPGEKKYQDGRGTSIIFSISYTVGGETRQQQVILTPTTQGQ